MGYTLKDVVGAKLTSCCYRFGALVMTFDNNRGLRVWPLYNSQEGLTYSSDVSLFVGEKVIAARFEMSTNESFYGCADDAVTEERHSRRLVLGTENGSLHICSTSFSLPPDLEGGRNYLVH